MTKHQIISKEIRAEIAAGKYNESGQLPSEAQLVNRFQVSRPTVARALQDLIAEGLIERRAGSGTYIRQGISKPMDTKATQVIGLLVPERGMTEIFDAICGELGALARMPGCGLLWGGSPIPHVDWNPTPEHALELCRQFVDKEVDGIFFAPLETGEDHENVNRVIVETLRQAGTPVVLLDRDVAPFPQRSHLDLVSVDHFSAGYLLAEHLIRLGCKELRFVVRPDAAPTVDARISGIREAMQQYKLKPTEALVATGDPTDPKFVRKIRAGRDVDAVICANDFTAGEVLKTLQELRIKVPEEVRVVGFDDVRYATLLPVALTTIHQPCRQIAEIAFRAMQERIQTPTIPPRTITTTPRLVVRESCGAYQRRS